VKQFCRMYISNQAFNFESTVIGERTQNRKMINPLLVLKLWLKLKERRKDPQANFQVPWWTLRLKYRSETEFTIEILKSIITKWSNENKHSFKKLRLAMLWFGEMWIKRARVCSIISGSVIYFTIEVIAAWISRQ
jgi:hypothetical protein